MDEENSRQHRYVTCVAPKASPFFLTLSHTLSLRLPRSSFFFFFTLIRLTGPCHDRIEAFEMAQLRRIYDSALVITPAINFIAEVYSRQSYRHVAPRAVYACEREGELGL